MQQDDFTYTYKPVWVANSFILKGKGDNINDIDPLKIQKLVYCLHGWHLAVTGKPAIGERFEAWPHGPVVSSLYHTFKRYRRKPISDLAEDVDPITGKISENYVPQSDTDYSSILSHVWDRYKNYTGTELSAMTHAEGTPWTFARENRLQYIPDNKIRDHYIALGSR